MPLQSVYCGAKSAIRGFTDSLRSQPYAAHGSFDGEARSFSWEAAVWEHRHLIAGAAVCLYALHRLTSRRM